MGDFAVFPLLLILRKRSIQWLRFRNPYLAIYLQGLPVKRLDSSGLAGSIGRLTHKGLARIQTDSAKVGESAESIQIHRVNGSEWEWKRSISYPKHAWMRRIQ